MMGAAENDDLPCRFDVRSEDSRTAAIQELRRSGAVILTNAMIPEGSWENFAKQVPFLLFSSDELLLKEHKATAVHVEQDGLDHLKGKALPPHTDGYIWGDSYPDFVILVCEQVDSTGGGKNYIIDGEKVMKRLDPETLNLLKTVPVDHTERSANGMAQGAESVVPVLQCRQKNLRLAWRRMVKPDYVAGKKKIDESSYVSLWSPMERGEKGTPVQQALLSLDQAILAEDRGAKRFDLQSGEVLIVDNYRMLHAREAYSVGCRRTWRVWSWTVDSNGLPPDVGDKELPATVKAAEEVISKKALQRVPA